MQRLGHIIAEAAILVISTSPWLAAQDDGTEVAVTTKLGIERVVRLASLSHIRPATGDEWDDTTLEAAASGLGEPSIALWLCQGSCAERDSRGLSRVYVVTPLRQVSSAATAADGLLVKLANGREFRGRLVSILTDKGGDSLDLRSTSAIRVSFKKQLDTPTAGPARWSLELDKPVHATFAISEPTFHYTYTSTKGYIVGYSWRHGSTQDLYLIRSDDEHFLVTPKDFRRLSFDYRPPEPGWTDRPYVQIEAPNGTVSDGQLGFKGDNRVETCFWYLAGDVPGEGYRVVVRRPSCQLTRTR